MVEDEDSKHLIIESKNTEIVERSENINTDYIYYDHNYASCPIKTEVDNIKIEDINEESAKDENDNENDWNYNNNDAWSNLAQLADISLTAAGHIDRPDLASHIKAARSLTRGDKQAGQEILEDIVKTVVGEDENKVVFISEDQLSSLLESSQPKPTKPTSKNQYILPRPDPNCGFFQPTQTKHLQPNKTSNIQISVPTNATHILICTAPPGHPNNPVDSRWPPNNPADPRWPPNNPADPIWPPNNTQDSRWPPNNPADPRWPPNNPATICPPTAAILNLLAPQPQALQTNQIVENPGEHLDIQLPDRRRTQAGKDCRAEYRCYICGKHYSTSSNLARHRQTHRSPEDSKARRCGVCGKVYVSMPAFSMHVRTHTAGCVCPHCGKVFSRPWLLKGHLRTHTGERPYKCPLCGKAFSDKSNLRAHVQTHSGSKPFPCGKCGKSFALRSYLVKHEESACGKNVANLLLKRISQSAPTQYNKDDTKENDDEENHVMEEGEILDDEDDIDEHEDDIDEDENSMDGEETNNVDGLSSDDQHCNEIDAIDSEDGRSVL